VVDFDKRSKPTSVLAAVFPGPVFAPCSFSLGDPRPSSGRRCGGWSIRPDFATAISAYRKAICGRAKPRGRLADLDKELVLNTTGFSKTLKPIQAESDALGAEG